MAEKASVHRHWLWAILPPAGAVLAMFGDVLFVADPPVLSSIGGDLWREFIFWREFGFSELGQGNLALWNPYVFCAAGAGSPPDAPSIGGDGGTAAGSSGDSVAYAVAGR